MTTLFKSRAGGGSASVLLMIATVLAVGGFFYWLSQNAVPTQGAPEEDASLDVGDATVVALEDFASGTGDYAGQAIALQGLRVTQLFGPQAFWVTLPDSVSTVYLVHMSAEAAADSVPVAAGSVVDVSGTVVPMSDSVLDAWEAAGLFVQENDRFLAEYAIDFFEAGRIAEAGDGPAG